MTTIDITDRPQLIQEDNIMPDLFGFLQTMDKKKALYSVCRVAITYEEYNETDCVFERKVVVYANNDYVKTLILGNGGKWRVGGDQ